MSDTYKIGEAAALLDLKTYVLRFWETEFPDILPMRTEKGQRMYTAEHLALLERIRFLLHERGLTIEGARKVLDEEKERGLRYEFGHRGALPNPDPFSETSDGSGDSGSNEPLQENAGLRVSFGGELPVYREVEPDTSELVGSALAAMQKEELSGQYKLPGIKKSFPSSALALDRATLEGYARNDEQLEHYLGVSLYSDVPQTADGQKSVEPAHEAQDPRMLPLFAVAKAAFLAGKAAGAAGVGLQADEASAQVFSSLSESFRSGDCAAPEGGRFFFNAGAVATPSQGASAPCGHHKMLRAVADELASIVDLLREKR